MHDITSNKHRGNVASVKAFRKGHGAHESTRRQIFTMLSETTSGLTSKEIAMRTGWALHTFSGRLAEMKRDGVIRGTGVNRYGAEVLEVVGRGKAEQMNLLECA